MRSLSILLLVITLCFSISTLLYNDYTNYTFENFVKEYSKSYESIEQLELSRVQFYDNLNSIKKHNSKKEKTFTMAVNKFADLSYEQMKAFKGLNKNKYYSSKSKTLKLSTLPNNNALPVSIDWRTKGAVSPVKNQKQCGAFSGTETIESHLYLATGNMLILSPQNMLECTPNPDKCGGTGGCEGATFELAFTWAENGIALESTVPYLGVDHSCNATVTKAAKTGAYIELPSNSANSLMTHLALVGPMAVVVDASAWQFYSGGVFNGCNATNPDIDHGVQAVGYGVDSVSGQGYWLVRNSWDTTWGEEGYIRLYRGPNETCGTDLNPQDGTACSGDTTPQKVCGTCGIWFGPAYPTNVELVSN